MKNPISERIVQLRTSAGLSQRDVAARMGVPFSTYQHLEYRYKRKYLDRDVAERLASAFSGTGVQEQDVMALSGGSASVDTDQDHSLLPVYDVAASAGHGVVAGYEAVAYSLAFPPEYLRKLTSTNHKNLMIISVKGDSMVPTLMDDDVVMIDVSKKSVNFDGLFVFRYGDALHVKRVTRAARPGYFVAISDNRSLYDPIEYRDDDVDVIGKVIWYGRKV